MHLRSRDVSVMLNHDNHNGLRSFHGSRSKHLEGSDKPSCFVAFYKHIDY